MKKIVLYVASALAMFAQARDTNRYDRVEVREGFEFSQRGGLGTSNEVVTAVSLPVVASNLAEGASFGPFSNAVAKVTPPVEQRAETDPFVSSWARKNGTSDHAKPVFSVTTNGTAATVTDGTLVLVEQDPQVSSWARKIGGQDAPEPMTGLPATTNLPDQTLRFGLGRIGKTALWKADAVYVCETNVYVESVTTNMVTVIDGTNVVYHPGHTEYSYSTNWFGKHHYTFLRNGSESGKLDVNTRNPMAQPVSPTGDTYYYYYPFTTSGTTPSGVTQCMKGYPKSGYSWAPWTCVQTGSTSWNLQDRPEPGERSETGRNIHVFQLHDTSSGIHTLRFDGVSDPNVVTNSTVVPGWYETNVVTHVETNVVVVLGTNIVDRTLGGVDSMVDGRGVISLGDDGRMTARSEAAMYDEAATNRGSAVSAAFARAVAANVGDDVLNSSDVNLTKTLGSGMLVGEFRVKSVRYELRIPKDLVHLVTPGEEKDLVARENGRTYLFGSSSVSGSQDYIRLGNGAFMWLRSLDDVWVGGSNSSTNSRGQETSVVHGALRMSTHLVHLVDSLIAATPRVIHAAQTNDQWFVDMKASALNSVQHGSDGFVAVSNAAMRSLSNYPDRIYDTSIRWDSPEWSSTGYVHTVLSDGKMEVKAYGWDPVPETVYYTSNRVGSASTEYPEFLLYRGSPSGTQIGGSYGYYYYSVSNLVYRHVLGTSEYEYDDEETKRTATCLSEGYWSRSGSWYEKIPWNGTPTVDPVATSYLFSVTSDRFPRAPRVRISDLKFYNASMGRLDYSSWGQTYVLNGQWGPLHVPKHSGTEAGLLAAANSGGHVTVGSVEYGYPNLAVSPVNSFGYYFDKSIGGGSGDHMGSSWEVHTNYHEYVVSLRSVTTNSFVTVPSSAVPQSWSSYSVDSAVLNGKVILMLKEGN